MKVEERVQAWTDEELSVLLSDYEVKEPKLASQCDKVICKMCVNPQCTNNALMCNELDCEKCGIKAHTRCLHISLRGITEMLGDRVIQQKNFLSDMFKIQNLILSEIFHSRKELTKKYFLKDLSEDHMKIYNDVFRDKKTVEYLKGEQAQRFYRELVKVNEKAHENANLLLENYRKSVKNMVDFMIGIKNRVYSSFVKVNVINNDTARIDSNILRKPLIANLEEFKLYDSFIVNHSRSLVDELTAEQGNFMKKILNNPKNVQLLYRGSQNAFTAATFHQKCDNIPNTLVLARTEFGKTIGGFTQYPWNAVSNAYVSDAGKKTFLFSLDMKQKFVPLNQNNLIYCHSGYGPVFGGGGGNDLSIANQGNINNNSSSTFPTVYNREGDYKLIKNQESYKLFSGATNGTNFKLLQYEVFRVIFH